MITLKNQNYFSDYLFDLLKVLRATVSFISSRDKKSYAEEEQTPFRLWHGWICGNELRELFVQS